MQKKLSLSLKKRLNSLQLSFHSKINFGEIKNNGENEIKYSDFCIKKINFINRVQIFKQFIWVTERD